jgi:hypothetical protein
MALQKVMGTTATKRMTIAGTSQLKAKVAAAVDPEAVMTA